MKTKFGISFLAKPPENEPISLLEIDEWMKNSRKFSRQLPDRIYPLIARKKSGGFKNLFITFLLYDFLGVFMLTFIHIVRFHVMSIMTETATDGTLSRDNLWLLYIATLTIGETYGAEFLAFVNVICNKLIGCPDDKRFFFLSSNFFLCRCIRNIVSHGPANDSLAKFIRRYGHTFYLGWYCYLFVSFSWKTGSIAWALVFLGFYGILMSLYEDIIRATFKWLKYSNKS